MFCCFAAFSLFKYAQTSKVIQWIKADSPNQYGENGGGAAAPILKYSKHIFVWQGISLTQITK